MKKKKTVTKAEVGKNCRHLPVPWVQPHASAPRDSSVCTQVNAEMVQLHRLDSNCWEKICVRKNCKKGGGHSPLLRNCFQTTVLAFGPCQGSHAWPWTLMIQTWPRPTDLTWTSLAQALTCLTTTDLSSNPWTVGRPLLPSQPCLGSPSAPAPPPLQSSLLLLLPDSIFMCQET